MTMKKCTRCHAEKPIECFGPRKDRLPAHQSRCKACAAEVMCEKRRLHPASPEEILRRRLRYAKSKDKLNAESREWRAKNPERVKARRLEWDAKNPEKVLEMYRRKRAKGFGLSLEQHDAMVERQQSRCAICGRHQSDLSRSLGVDHDHSTGAVRELLCVNCNAMLGHALDSTDLLKRAIKYLTKHNAKGKRQAMLPSTVRAGMA